MNTRRSLIACATFFLCGNAIGATTTNWGPILRVNSEKDVYVLKVGHATFDSFINTTSSPAFSHLGMQLKRFCSDSRGRDGNSNWRRRIDIDLALGSDYQVLDWLETARIDAAMISPLALQLHTGGKPAAADLVRFNPRGAEDGMVVYQPQLRSFNAGSPQPRPDPEADFHAFLASLTNATPSPRHRWQLISPSHISGAGFVVPLVYAQRWFQHAFADPRARHSMESNFWDRFFQRLEFSLGRFSPVAPGSGADDTVVIEFSSDARSDGHNRGDGWTAYTNATFAVYKSLTNVLVARTTVSEKLLSSAEARWFVATNSDPFIDALRTNDVLQSFIQRKFSISELVRLLRVDQETSGQAELSLVLSGGGVKAAYQSALIDHLYSKGQLSNATNPPPSALQVKSIVGNSGGALLGFFVAGLENGHTNLSTVLWGKPDAFLSHGDIFGWMDLMRWASFVVCIWISIVAVKVATYLLARGALCLEKCRRGSERFLSRYRKRVQQLVPVPIPGNPVETVAPSLLVTLPSSSARAASGDPGANYSPPETFYTLAPGYKWTFTIVLALTPFFLRTLNGHHGREHIPAIEGIFYFLCLFFALLIDSCIKPPQSAFDRARDLKKIHAPTRSGRREWQLGPVLMILIGAAICVFLVFCLRKPWTTELLGQQITKGALLFCIGILLFEGGLIWHLFVQKDRCGFEGRGDYLRAVFLALFIILLTYAGLAVLALIDKVSFLEVTWAFWIALAVLATIGSLLCFWLGTRKICPNWIRAALKFQLSKHPSGFLRLSRVARMHLLFTIGFLWWNLALAPAIYGNATAREYLHAAHARFVKKADGTPRPYKLQTLYAAPANDLERDRERYFLFYPIRDDQSIAVSSLKTRLDNDVRKRWSVFPSSEGDDHMKQVVFASGSPFPIFSPHQVKPRAGEPEWLVDGGFAHNIPLEAAKEIGARQVLLLNSSPADSFEASGSLLEHLGSALGQLPQGIPRLLPFLFRRSQVADLLIREQMFVVCLSPLPEKDWPSLVDFRRTVVQRLLNTAADHTHQRIGHIETAGPPVFLISVRMGRGESLPSLGGE